MSAITKLMTPGGGGVQLTPASSIASDVTVQIPSTSCTLASTDNLSSFKNRIINGGMSVSQRGTSFSTGIGTLTYTLDRWICAANTAALTVTQGAASTWPYNYMVVTGAASNTAWTIRQRIESKNIQDCAGTQVTVSFYCYNTTGNASNVTVGIYSANSADNFSSTTLVSSQAVNLSASSTLQTFTFTLTSACSNGIEVQIGSGSSFTSGNLVLHTVQLEKGSTATSFDYRPYGTELALCQRYYLRNSNDGTFASFGIGVVSATNVADRCYVPFPVKMRTAPTINYSTIRVYDGGTTSAVTSININTSTTFAGAFVLGASGGGLAVGRPAMLIDGSSGNGWIDFSAEL